MTLAPASTSWGRKGSAGDRRIAAGVRLHVCLWVCVGLCVCISMYEVLLLQSCDCQTIHFMSLNESLMMINWSPKTKTTDIYPSLFNAAQAKFWSRHTHMHIQNTHTHTHTHTHTRTHAQKHMHSPEQQQLVVVWSEIIIQCDSSRFITSS